MLGSVFIQFRYCPLVSEVTFETLKLSTPLLCTQNRLWKSHVWFSVTSTLHNSNSPVVNPPTRQDTIHCDNTTGNYDKNPGKKSCSVSSALTNFSCIIDPERSAAWLCKGWDGIARTVMSERGKENARSLASEQLRDFAGLCRSQLLSVEQSKRKKSYKLQRQNSKARQKR